jgi:hypothetical protein
MQVDKVVDGERYHTVICGRCNSPIHAFHARSDDERLPGPGLFSVRCPTCAYPDLYKPAAFAVCFAGQRPELEAAARPRRRGPERRQQVRTNRGAGSLPTGSNSTARH